MKIDALVPIKEHSERLPSKNFREINGRPLFMYVIDTLKSVPSIDQIYINTDSKLIEDYYGDDDEIIILERDKDVCHTSTSMNKIIKSSIPYINSDIILQTHVTNPLLTATTIEKAIQFYLNNMNIYDSLFSVTPSFKRYYDIKGNPINHNPNRLIPTQTMTPLLEENSCIYLFSKTTFSKYNNRIGRHPYMFYITFPESLDIDEIWDFLIAKCIIENGGEYEKIKSWNYRTWGYREEKTEVSSKTS